MQGHLSGLERTGLQQPEGRLRGRSLYRAGAHGGGWPPLCGEGAERWGGADMHTQGPGHLDGCRSCWVRPENSPGGEARWAMAVALGLE